MTLDEAKKTIFKAKPEFAKLYNEYGNKPWIQYAKEKYLGRSDYPRTERQTEFLTAFEKILTPLLGKGKTNQAIHTLKENSLVSSADHHGVLCHPFFSNASLVRSHPSLITHPSSLITFSCGCISLTNSSYPRGIFFHDDNLKEIRMPFTTLRGRRRSLYGLSSISKSNIQKHIDKLQGINISEQAKIKLKKFLSKIIDNNNVFEQDQFSSQLTIINDILWDELFGNTRGNLVYLEIETLVRELLLSNHIDNETPIHKIIFDSATRESYIENFEKVIGAQDTKNKKGSHIFWYIDETENARKQLFLNGNNLETLDQKISIPLSPNTIREYLLRHELLPSMAFCYSLISFYYGITLGGGFSQIQYLGDIKNSFKKTVGEIIDVKTNIFTGEEVLVTLGNENDRIPASLIDILLYGENINTNINNEIEDARISETLNMMMPEFIEIVTGKRESLEKASNQKPTFHV